MAGIIDPRTGHEVDPRNTMGMSASGLVDPTSVTRPTVRIKDNNAPKGFRIINLEDFRPETMTRISDPKDANDAPIEIITSKKAEKAESEVEEEIDLNEMSKSELIEFAAENEIDIDKNAKVADIRKAIEEALS